MICDIHTHNTNPRFPSLADISGSGDLFSAASPLARLSMGIHPRLAGEPGAMAMLERIREAARTGAIQAVGECGLDKMSPCPREAAARIFSLQASIAAQYGLPLVVHCVRLYPEIVRILKISRFPNPVILHSYNGNPETTAMLLRLERVYFSFCLLRNSTGLRSLPIIPASRILLESDAEAQPDYAGAIRAMALAMRIEPQELEDAIFANFSKILKIKP